MITVQGFTFGPFEENTYVLFDESKECVIIDPGCSNKSEQEDVVQFISDEGLKPVKLLNTHCHVDHVLGNSFISFTLSSTSTLAKRSSVLFPLRSGSSKLLVFGIR